MLTSSTLTVLLIGLLMLFSIGVERADSAKILGYFVTPSRSHYIIHESLMRGLAAKGHEVTVLSLFDAPKKPVPNVRYLKVDMSEAASARWAETVSNLFNMSAKQENFLLTMPKFLSEVTQLNVEILQSPLVERLKREESFDLVAIGWFMNDYQIGLASHFKCPAVIITSTPSMKLLRDYVGNPTGASHVPFVMFPYKQMTFLQRVMNYLALSAEGLIVSFVDNHVFEPVYRTNFPPGEYPSYADAKKNVALVLVTSHFSQSAPMASFPSMIEVSGMHISKEAGVLPKNIQHWLDTAEHGVIFFSMGSNVKSTQITADRRAAILNVFAKLKQRVLWKWEDEDLPGRPDNVMIQKWLPQSDILAHPNVKLFITHCGKGSINEARFRGVPLLGIPVFADQPNNMDVVVAEGWAVPLQYANLTEQTFGDALQEALSNPKYGDVVRKEAQLFVDRPMHPLDTAVYWVEYVIRHKGAKHMQSQAVHLNWFQYYSLDVVAFLTVVVWVAWKLTVLFGRFMFRLAFRRSTKKAKKD